MKQTLGAVNHHWTIRTDHIDQSFQAQECISVLLRDAIEPSREMHPVNRSIQCNAKRSDVLIMSTWALADCGRFSRNMAARQRRKILLREQCIRRHVSI